MRRNANLGALHSNYLFAEINQRKQEFLKREPSAKIISLGVGDTTMPISQPVISAWKKGAEALGTLDGYTGYEPYKGRSELCQAIVDRFYPEMAKAEEIFISDGAKSALGRLQLLYPENAVIGVQDPAYPVYIDTSVVMGHASHYDKVTSMYQRLVYLPCTKENGFFPDFKQAPPVDVLYICSPNNPTGMVPSFQQLEELVQYAKRNHTLIIYDSAYAAYIGDSSLPRTIYAIPGAREVAIEVGSFSKLAGFSGVRLGWVVVPDALKYNEGGHLHKDWSHINSIFFNGASNLAQIGGLAVLSEQGWQDTMDLVHYYKENAHILRQAIQRRGLKVAGSEHAPYLWVETEGSSWDMFDYFLENYHLITTPGIGFGPSGEGYLRFSALGRRDDILEATERLRKGLQTSHA